MEGGAVGHNFERDPPRDYPCQVWFNLVQRFQRRRFKCDLLSKYIIINYNIYIFNKMNTCQQTNLFKKKNKKMEIFILGGVALENMMNK
jgi:hypothetical protein